MALWGGRGYAVIKEIFKVYIFLWIFKEHKNIYVHSILSAYPE